jgi:pimeloyl-ACP methyl ester carboxylesterase
VDGGSISLTASVLGGGDPVYFLPGFLGDHELFALTAWLLHEQHCCVMIDPPQLPTTQATVLEQCGQTLLRMADQLDHDRIRLHATSFGSLIGLQAMLEDPQRIAAASLHCGFANCELTIFERTLASLGLRSRRSLGELRAAIRLQTANHQHWFPPFDSTRWEFYSRNALATPVRDIARRALLAHAVDLNAKLDRLQTPILLIACEGDGRMSSVARSQLNERLPACRRESLDNCGRLPHVTHPHRLVKSLRAFWEETT